MANVFRVYVEKKAGNDIEARHILEDLKTNVGIKGIENLRIINRYDAERVSKEEFAQAVREILSEPNLDNVYDEIDIPSDWRCFATEFLPGQYDQRADSAAQCILGIRMKKAKELLSSYVSPPSKQYTKSPLQF